MTGANTFEKILETEVRDILDFIDLGEFVSSCIAHTCDRRSWSAISPPQKASLGCFIESRFINFASLPTFVKGIDTEIAGVPVDIKTTTAGNGWMFGPECVGHWCILFRTNIKKRKTEVGFIQAMPEYLNTGRNRDSKVSLKKEAVDKITWVGEAFVVIP